MIGLETSLWGLGVAAGSILWHLCVVRNRERLWGWIELWGRANRAAARERKRVIEEGII